MATITKSQTNGDTLSINHSIPSASVTKPNGTVYAIDGDLLTVMKTTASGEVTDYNPPANKPTLMRDDKDLHNLLDTLKAKGTLDADDIAWLRLAANTLTEMYNAES